MKVLVLPGLMDSETRDAITKTTWDNFSTVLNKLALNKNVTILNAKHLLPADENFIDRVHLNTTASANYSNDIAEYFIEQNLFR